MKSVLDSMYQLETLTRERLTEFPGSPFFNYSSRELETIKRRYTDYGSFDRAFYESLNMGVMCARELESVDPEYCDKVYFMLERIRLTL